MVNKAKSFLKGWIVSFIKNRDVIFKKVVSIDMGKRGFDVVVEYKDKEQFFLVEPVIGNLDDILKRFSEDKHYVLVVFNSLGNFNKIVENWSKLIKFRFLGIYFVNPFSSLDKKWIIFPCTHHRICDENSLKKGLRSMFEMVDPLSGGQIEARFK